MTSFRVNVAPRLETEPMSVLNILAVWRESKIPYTTLAVPIFTWIAKRFTVVVDLRKCNHHTLEYTFALQVYVVPHLPWLYQESRVYHKLVCLTPFKSARVSAMYESATDEGVLNTWAVGKFAP